MLCKGKRAAERICATAQESEEQSEQLGLQMPKTKYRDRVAKHSLRETAEVIEPNRRNVGFVCP